MQRDSHILLCLLLLITQHVKADGDCRDKKDVTVKEGEELKLITSIEPLKRCYFVLTDNDSSDQCCFNRKGSNDPNLNTLFPFIKHLNPRRMSHRECPYAYVLLNTGNNRAAVCLYFREERWAPRTHTLRTYIKK